MKKKEKKTKPLTWFIDNCKKARRQLTNDQARTAVYNVLIRRYGGYAVARHAEQIKKVLDKAELDNTPF